MRSLFSTRRSIHKQIEFSISVKCVHPEVVLQRLVKIFQHLPRTIFLNQAIMRYDYHD